MLSAFLSAALLTLEPVVAPKDAAFKVEIGAQLVLQEEGDNWRIEAGEAPSGLLVEEKVIDELRDDESAMGQNARRIRLSSDLPPIEPGKLHLFFTRIGSDTVLIIQNGMDTAYHYSAVMERGGERSVTDVCQIFAHERTIEHWPYAIDAIILHDLAPSEVREDGRPICR